MYFKQILNEDCGCSSYIVASRDSHECAVVDPALDIQPYLEVMQDRGMTLRYIIDTHIHADHVSGNRRLSAETNKEQRGTVSIDGDISFERYDNPGFALTATAQNFRAIDAPGLANARL